MAEAPRVVSFADKPMQAFSMEERKKAVPAYTVEPLKRKTVVNKTIKDEIGFRVVPTEVEVDGYMVRTLRGDSVFVTHDDLVRMKLDRNLVPLLVEGSDDPVGMQQTNPLTDRHKMAIEMVTQMLEKDPNLLNKLLASTQQAEDET